MSRRITICFIITALILTLSSCSQKADNNPSIIEESQDIIIPPESTIDLFSNSNQRNISNLSNSYQQNIVNKLYDEIGINEKVIDFAVDESMIYVLNKKSSTDNGVEFGDTIEAYGIEDSKLKTSVFLDKTKCCTALTVWNEKLYTYDYFTGDILVYAIGGNLKKTITSGFSGVSVNKMQVDDHERVFLKADNGIADNICIYVVQEGQSAPVKIDRDRIINSMGYDVSQVDLSDIFIQDFCIKDSNSILIKVFPERICLYDVQNGAVKNVSYIPDSANFIDYDSGILYHSSNTKVTLMNNNFANFVSKGGHYYVGRILINENFQWSLDPLSLKDFQLGDIIVPYKRYISERLQMRQNNKYVFFVDYSISIESNEKNVKSFIYRVAK